MDIRDILCHCDHTLLAQTATWDEIKTVLDDGVKYGVASCCIPPSFVKRAKEYVGDKMKICTVIGFPNGYNTADVKLFETEQAIKEGADEIDMVVNIGDVKEGKFKKVTDEIKLLKNACGKKILKVIIETCLLTDAEKIAMCRAVTDAGADYIKTSTGFSKGGATFDDVELFGKHVGENVRIKAAGGISSLADAEKFLALGADRLGTSRIVKLAKEKENEKR
ncbi:MAG: deoxyribose-phosphate aldolase [Eubacteriales bacterium]|nr:deoxyribose-phosphate aldolase [Eubacteriales bacterium]